MDFLYLLENLRNPILDKIMLTITAFGEEIIFMAVAVILLWCVDKFEGYYMLTVGFIGTGINQLLKVIFRVPRPWVKNPDFKPVGGAVKEATGYSFPSGHTQSAVGTFGSLARWNANKILRICFIILPLLIAFSRMYLGVHTPADVLTSLAIASLLVLCLYPLFKKFKQNPNLMFILLAVLSVLSVLQVLFMELFPFPSNETEILSGVKNSYKMAGAIIGLDVVYFFDLNFIKFKTDAVWWAQIIKVVLGLALVLVIKEVSYAVFSLFLGEYLYRAAAYFLMVIFAGTLWPLTFPLFSKLGKKRTAKNGEK